MTAVSVRGLGKAYGPLRALDEVSLEITPGELFCVSGPDAAGKSTLLRILAGTLSPDSEMVSVRCRHLLPRV
jgi:ABC-type multidrug transport system ATPase subunit